MFIGVDVGTSVTKAVGFDDRGRVVVARDVKTELTHLSGGRVEQDIDQVIAAAAEVIHGVAAEMAAPPSLVAVTGQGDGMWLVDTNGRPVRPAISWLDARAADIVRTWDRDGTADVILRSSGGMVFPGSAAPILAYLDQYEPATLDRAASAVNCKDVIFQRFTGERGTDVSDASFPFTNARIGAYDDDTLAACGLAHRRSLLAPVAAGGLMAPIHREAAAQLGVPAGTLLSAGPYDLPASARGSGVTEVGDGLMIVGTTLACQAVTDDPGPIPHRAGLLLATWQPQRWLRAMPAMVGTASLAWLLELLGLTVTELPGLLTATAPGASGVTALPYWSASGERAPFVEASARGRFDGLHVGTTKADLVRALCEGLAYAARHCFDAAGLTGRLAVCGGGAQSMPWMQMFADVLCRPIDVVDVEQAGALGAVLCATDARGETPDWPIPHHTVEPDAGRAAFYAEAFAGYVRRVDAARSWWAAAMPAPAEVPE